MPILSSVVFDNTGQPYNVTKILTPDFYFDEAAYKSYSRVFLPTTYILSYTVQFALLPALIVHTICWYGEDTWQQFGQTWHKAKDETADVLHRVSSSTVLSRRASSFSRQSTTDDLEDFIGEEDIPLQAGAEDGDVPASWYIMTGVTMTAVGIFVVEIYEVHLPWYGLLIALGICTALFIPIGIIQAITSQQISLYLISQILCGFLFSGRPVANMVFTTYSYVSNSSLPLYTSNPNRSLPPKASNSLQTSNSAKYIWESPPNSSSNSN
jgi:hypothetical protein